MLTCKICKREKDEWHFDLHIVRGEIRESPFDEVCRVCKTKGNTMKTFVIIKPDAITQGLIGKIISRFEDAGFEIKRIEMLQKDIAWFGQMYAHLQGNVWIDMRDFMLSRPLIGVVLKGSGAIGRVRKMVGFTNSSEAKPGTIRSDYGGHPIRYNCVHASDSEETVTKEIALFFGDNND